MSVFKGEKIIKMDRLSEMVDRVMEYAKNNALKQAKFGFDALEPKIDALDIANVNKSEFASLVNKMEKAQQSLEELGCEDLRDHPVFKAVKEKFDSFNVRKVQQFEIEDPKDSKTAAKEPSNCIIS